MPGPAAGGELPLPRVVELAAELDKGGAAKANNAVRLVSVLNDSKDAVRGRGKRRPHGG